MAQLIFWNKLGSATEVANSMVGVNATTVTNVTYDACQFNNGLKTAASGASYAYFNFGTNTRDNFTIEWWAKCLENPDTVNSYLVMFGDISGSGNRWIAFFDYGGRYWRINTSGNDLHNYSRASLGITQNSIHHWGVAFDFTQSNNADKVKLYIDGVFKSPSSTDGAFNKSMVMLYAGTVYGSNSYGQIIDNVKMWDYTKTDFSDRFDEYAGYGKIPLKLWNLLGSSSEVAKSIEGGSGTETSVTYDTGYFNNGVKIADTGASYLTFDRGTNSQDYLTISFWMKTLFDPATTSYQHCFIGDIAGAGNRLLCYYDASVTGSYKWRFGTSGSDYNEYDISTLNITQNSTHSIMLICDFTLGTNADRVKLYLDGVLKTPDTTAGTFNKAFAYVFVGNKDATKHGNFVIDNFKVYHSSTIDVNSIYNERGGEPDNNV